MVLQTKGSLLTCRCFSNAQVSFFAQRFALENHPTCFLAKLALRRTIGAWSEPRLLEAPKHLLWIDDESRHAESALEDAFKAFSSLGVNQLNVSGTFNWHRACGSADVFFLQPRIWKKFTWLYGVLPAQTRQYATELHEGLARSLQEYLTTRPTTRSASKLGQSACTSRGHPNLFRLLDQMMSCFVWIPFSDFALPSHPAICHA